MGLFRFAALAISIGLMIPSAHATIEPSAPPSLTDSHTLNLRAAGSRLVIDTIEDALRQGGAALFDEEFQLDSSLNWVFGENIEGEVDAVVPLWSRGRHAAFVQPGFVFWTGLADEERIDGNLGIAYRTGLTEDVIGGASIFYDRDFKQGHSRVSFGADVQSGFFHGAANYYQPLSDEEDGREGFIEEALRGMDFRIAIQRDIMRASVNLGYWRFEGEDAVEADWEISYGFDAGIRVFPGVFIEGGWEHHDEDVSLDSRWNAGLSFRFSLPDFKGASYGDGSMSSNLYRAVEREKRILYEERIAGPSVSIARAQGESGNLREDDDNPASIQIRLSEALEEDVTLYLVGSGTATYGASADYQVSVGDETCDAITTGNCRVTIPMGLTGADVMVTARKDGGGEPAETIVLSIVIDSAGDTGLTLGSPSSLTLNIVEDPTAGLVLSSSTVEEPETGTIEHRIAVALSASPVAAVALDASFDTSNSTADMADDYSGNDRQKRVVFAAGATGNDLVQEIVLIINADDDPEDDETIVLTLGDRSDSLASNGNNFTLENTRHVVTILANDQPAAAPTVSLNYSGNMTIAEGDLPRMTIELSEALSEDVTINIVGGGTATYDVPPFNFDDWQLQRRVLPPGEMPGSNFLVADPCPGITGSSCQVEITAGSTLVDVQIQTFLDGRTEGEETINVSIEVDSGSVDLVELGSPSSQTIHIAGDTPATPTGMTLGFAEMGATTDETRSGTQNIRLRGVVKDASGAKLSTLPVDLPITLSITNNQDGDIIIDTAPGSVLTPSGVTFDSNSEFLLIFAEIVDDATAEEEEMFVVTLGEGPNFPSGWSVDANANTFTITINENDQAISE